MSWVSNPGREGALADAFASRLAPTFAMPCNVDASLPAKALVA
jgi:hypothetical protein